MRGVAERQLAVADVGRLHRDRQPVLTDPMRDHRLERAGPAGLRMDANPVGHRVRSACRPAPRARSGRGHGWRCAERGSLSASCCADPVEDVAAVANPVRPGDQILAPAGLIISSTPNPRTTSRPSTEKLRNVAPTSVITARWAPETDLVLLAGGEMLTNRHFSGRGICTHYPWSAMSTAPDAPSHGPRTYQIRTHGCQMNVHDSERLAGLLEEAGYRRSAPDTQPDVVVFNTCAVRENADNRLYGSLGNLLPAKKASPGMQIAVGGCLAQKDKDAILDPRAVGRRRVRHAQHRLAAGAAGTGPNPARGAGRDQGGAGDLPLQPADPSGLGLRGLGVHQRRLQQHLHLLHRAQRCAVERPTAGQATSSPRSRRWSPKESRRSRCSARTSTRTGSSSATVGPSRNCSAPAVRSTGWNGSASPRPTRRTSPTT